VDDVERAPSCDRILDCGWIAEEFGTEDCGEPATMEGREGRDNIDVSRHSRLPVVPRSNRARNHVWDACGIEAGSDELEHRELVRHPLGMFVSWAPGRGPVSTKAGRLRRAPARATSSS